MLQRVSSVSGTPLKGKSLVISPSGRAALLTEEEAFVFENADDHNLLVSSAINPATTLRPWSVAQLPQFESNSCPTGATRFDSIAWISEEILAVTGFSHGDAIIDFVHRSSLTTTSLVDMLPDIWCAASVVGLDGVIGNLVDRYPNCHTLLRSSRLVVAPKAVAIGNILLVFVTLENVVAFEFESEISCLEISGHTALVGTVAGSLHAADFEANTRSKIFANKKFPITRLASLPISGGRVVLSLSGNRVIGNFLSSTDFKEFPVDCPGEISDLLVNPSLGCFHAIQESGRIFFLGLQGGSFSVVREISVVPAGKICSAAVSVNGVFLYLAIFSKRVEIFRLPLVAGREEISNLLARHDKFASLEDVYSIMAIHASMIGNRGISDPLTLTAAMARLGFTWAGSDEISDKFPILVGLHYLYWSLHRQKNAVRSGQVLATETNERRKLFEKFPGTSLPETCSLCAEALRYEAESRRLVCGSHWFPVSSVTGDVLAWDADVFECRHCGHCAEQEGVVCPLCLGSILSRK